jgi:hypothetical protein
MKQLFADQADRSPREGWLTSGKDDGRSGVHRLCPLNRLESIMASNTSAVHREPWNKGKIVGQKAPFELKDIWALRIRLQMEGRVRELALFNLGIDSKLSGCDQMALKVRRGAAESSRPPKRWREPDLSLSPSR